MSDGFSGKGLMRMGVLFLKEHDLAPENSRLVCTAPALPYESVNSASWPSDIIVLTLLSSETRVQLKSDQFPGCRDWGEKTKDCW